MSAGEDWREKVKRREQRDETEGDEKKNGRTRRRTADASEATEKEGGRESGECERQRRNGGGRRAE